jgi:uncharacterized delta-60 repeat protein
MSPIFQTLEPRLLLNAGQLDPSFGNAGVLIDTAVTVPAGVDRNGSPVPGSPVDRVLIQPDGKILVAGHGNGSIFLERYTPAGLPDPSFNGTGREAIAPAPGADAYNYVSDLRVLPDGRIAFTSENVIGRLLPSGAPDPSLNPGSAHPGTEQVPISASTAATVTAAAALPDGKFVFAATGPLPTDLGTDTTPFYIGRLNADGSIDTSFGAAGLVTEPLILYNIANQMTATADGTIFVIGTGGNSYGQDTRFHFLLSLDESGNIQPGDGTIHGRYPWLIRRLDADNGILLSAADYGSTAYGMFSAAGHLIQFPQVSTVPLTPDAPADLRILNVDANGDLYAGGSIASLTGNGTDFAIARFTAAGHVDRTFGADGLVRLSFGANRKAGVADLAFDAAGNLLVTGTVDSHPALVRLFNSVGPGDAPDVSPPRAYLVDGPRTISSPKRFVTFKVTYTDDGQIDPSYKLLFNPVLQIVEQRAKSTKPRPSQFNDKDLYAFNTLGRVTYTYTFRGKHNGTYAIQLLGGQVTDEAGNSIPTTTLATFSVNIGKGARAQNPGSRGVKGASYGHAQDARH